MNPFNQPVSAHTQPQHRKWQLVSLKAAEASWDSSSISNRTSPVIINQSTITGNSAGNRTGGGISCVWSD